MSPNRPLKLDDIKKPDLVAGDHQFREEEAIDAEVADVDAPADYTGAYEMTGDAPALTLFVMTLIGMAASLVPQLAFLLSDYIADAAAVLGWLLSVIIAFPAMIFAGNDLESIRLGRLSNKRHWMVRAAFWLAVLTVLSSAATVVTTVLYIYLGPRT